MKNAQTLNNYFCFFNLKKTVTDSFDMSCLGAFSTLNVEPPGIDLTLCCSTMFSY